MACLWAAVAVIVGKLATAHRGDEVVLTGALCALGCHLE